MRRFVQLVVLAFTAACALPRAAAAQYPQTREGFWFHAGLGYGSLGCEDCSGRASALSGELQLGGTISPHVQLGAGTNDWVKSVDGETLTVGSFGVVARFYTSAKGGFYILGGLGYGSIKVDDGFGNSATETGGSAVVGVGYDIRVGKNVSLTPFYNSFAVAANNDNANVAQFGIGITVH